MEPSVKFVLTIIGAFPNQKKWGYFFVKQDKPGGARGWFVFRMHFFPYQFLEQMPLICSSTFPPISFSSLLLCVQSGLTRGRGGVRGDQGAHTGQEISNFKPKYCLKSKGVGGMSKIKSRVLNVSQSQLIMGSVCTAQQGS